MQRLTRTFYQGSWLTITLVLVLTLFLTRPIALPTAALPPHKTDVSNGERIFNAGGCASCHAASANDSSTPVLGGGLGLETPFGVFRVPNISPDPVNGIGRWSMLDFVTAMHLGVSPDNRHYYPAFPYTSYGRMRFEDLMDLKSYLDTLPPSQRHSESHALKFPWNFRAGLGLWKLFNFKPEPVTKLPPGDTQARRGRYLVEGPGHCGECHTPRTWTGGLDYGRWLGGAPNPDGEGRVPNITPDKDGLADWSSDDIEYFLESGFKPDFDTVGGSMVDVQENLARLPAADRAAIVAYLKFIPAID